MSPIAGDPETTPVYVLPQVRLADLLWTQASVTGAQAIGFAVCSFWLSAKRMLHALTVPGCPCPVCAAVCCDLDDGCSSTIAPRDLC